MSMGSAWWLKFTYMCTTITPFFQCFYSRLQGLQVHAVMSAVSHTWLSANRRVFVVCVSTNHRGVHWHEVWLLPVQLSRVRKWEHLLCQLFNVSVATDMCQSIMYIYRKILWCVQTRHLPYWIVPCACVSKCLNCVHYLVTAALVLLLSHIWHLSPTEQFSDAGLSIFNNNWSNIHDFTPVAEHRNFHLHGSDVMVSEHIPPPKEPPLATVTVSYEADSSVVPRTLGTQRKHSDEVIGAVSCRR